MITAVTAIGALVFTGLSLNATREQTALAEQGQITDRYGKGVEQIGRQGPENLQIRLGGIYALERLARDSPRDQPTIIEVLSAFIRTSTSPAPDKPCAQGFTSADVQAALTVLGRRNSRQDNGTRIDLHDACLQGADLIDLNLANIDLTKASLVRSFLAQASLAGGQLSEADFRNAVLYNANLDRADLENADLSNADLGQARLTDAFLDGSNLSGADLNRANFTGASLNSADLSGATLTGTNFTDADLEGANLTSAHSDPTPFRVIDVPNFTEANLNEADVTEADIPGANLTNAYLYLTNLTRARLNGANLSGARHNENTRTDGAITDSNTRGKWW